MSIEDIKDMEKPARSAWDDKVVRKYSRKQASVPNQALHEMVREAEKAGYGPSYGKYVQKSGK